MSELHAGTHRRRYARQGSVNRTDQKVRVQGPFHGSFIQGESTIDFVCFRGIIHTSLELLSAAFEDQLIISDFLSFCDDMQGIIFKTMKAFDHRDLMTHNLWL